MADMEDQAKGAEHSDSQDEDSEDSEDADYVSAEEGGAVGQVKCLRSRRQRQRKSVAEPIRGSVVQNNYFIDIDQVMGSLYLGPTIHVCHSRGGQHSHRAHHDACRTSLRVVQDEEALPLAQRIGSGWRRMGQELSIQADLLGLFQSQSSSSRPGSSPAYRTLVAWLQMADQGATVSCLAKALDAANETAALDSLRP